MHLHALHKCSKPWLMCQSCNWRVPVQIPGQVTGWGALRGYSIPIAPWVQVKCCPQLVCLLLLCSGWVKCRGHIHYYQIFVCANISMWQWHMYRFKRTKLIRLPRILPECWEKDVLIWFRQVVIILPYHHHLVALWCLHDLLNNMMFFALLCFYFILILKHLHMFSYGKLSHCDRFEPNSIQGWSWTAL